MANIRVDVDHLIHDGAEIKFRSPVDCSAITGLVVHYPDSTGSTVSKEFTFTDAHGRDISKIDHPFGENVVVKVILDLNESRAFVQNADTNAYLEAQLAGKAPAGYGLGSAKQIFATEIDSTYKPGWYFCNENYTLNNYKSSRWWIFVKAARDGATFATQELYAVYGNDVYKFERHRIQGGDWGAAIRCDAGVFAPAGYGGYGECPAKNSVVEDESALEVHLDTILNSMENGTTIRTAFGVGKLGDNIAVANWTWLATIFKSSSGYAIVSAQSGWGKRVAEIRKAYSAGVWQPVEWVSPPLRVGEEYRTTERFYDEPVYAKLINFGYGPSSTKEVAIADYIGDLVRIDGYWYRDSRFFCESFTSASFIDKVHVCQRTDNSVSPAKNYWALGVEVSKDCSSYKGIAAVYYTKREV